ncbi:hypothetical protein [Ralstonia sp. SET104]|uniref:hypothetical protein n=1 Tax=Ralstonia sp. SET104 TaxID=2448774 RepID=UPI000F56DB08|nr:hypothetical protein [Ralstonia sp. SET104]GCB06650.1 hypothetical protein PSUB009319_42810 [Ralstonia sp. SET104]
MQLTSRPAPVLPVPVPPALRSLIDQAINSVLEDAALRARLTAGPVGRCADYAIVGARVLTLLTGHPYLAVAGGELIDCGSGRYIVLNPPRAARRVARKLSELKEYHCWIQSLHDASGSRRRLEIVDFTVRHDWDVAKLLGVPFTRSTADSYLWEWDDAIGEVPTQARVHVNTTRKKVDWLWEDANSTRLLRKYEKDYDALFRQLTALTIARLADDIEMALAAQ